MTEHSSDGKIFMMRESYVNETEGHRFEDSDWYEPFTDDRGRLFRSLQREYGRCTSKMYVDDSETPGGARSIGWVFEKRTQYTDSGRYGSPAAFYLQATWVELGVFQCDECLAEPRYYHKHRATVTRQVPNMQRIA